MRLNALLKRFDYLRRCEDGRFELGTTYVRLVSARDGLLYRVELLQATVRSRHTVAMMPFYSTCARAKSASAYLAKIPLSPFGTTLGSAKQGPAGLMLMACAGEPDVVFDHILVLGVVLSLGGCDPT